MGSFRGAKVLTHTLSLILRRIFVEFGQFFFSELLRPFASFSKFFAVLGILKVLKIFVKLCVCSDLYAYVDHMRQELMHTR
jgi:hypothetical protein